MVRDIERELQQENQQENKDYPIKADLEEKIRDGEENQREFGEKRAEEESTNNEEGPQAPHDAPKGKEKENTQDTEVRDSTTLVVKQQSQQEAEELDEIEDLRAKFEQAYEQVIREKEQRDLEDHREKRTLTQGQLKQTFKSEILSTNFFEDFTVLEVTSNSFAGCNKVITSGC